MHSVRLEPAKMILIGTRTTYQATGDADLLALRAKNKGMFLLEAGEGKGTCVQKAAGGETSYTKDSIIQLELGRKRT